MNFFKIAIEEGVGVVTINNPPANALSTSVVKELAQVVEQLTLEKSVKVIVLTGAGKFFIAGADIKELSGLDQTNGHSTSQLGQRVFNTLEQMDKPWIAAINGACLGGGLELAMACHVRIADESAKLGLPEVKLGIIPGFGGTQRMPRITNPAKATELILSGEMISGAEAARIGLVNRVVPDGQAFIAAKELAKTMAGYGVLALRAAIQSIRMSFKPMEEGLKFEAERFGKMCSTSDMHEGMNAFLEKRAPKFEDR